MTDITYEFDGGPITEDTLRDLAQYEDAHISPAFERDRILHLAAKAMGPGWAPYDYDFTGAIDRVQGVNSALGFGPYGHDLLWPAVALWRTTGPESPAYQREALRDVLDRLNAARVAV